MIDLESRRVRLLLLMALLVGVFFALAMGDYVVVPR